MKFKGRYKGNKTVKLEVEPGLSIDEEVFVETKDASWPENKKEKKKQKDKEGHAFEEIAKLAKHFGRSDLSERHHEILGDLIE